MQKSLSRNYYFHLGHKTEFIDVFSPKKYQWGKDFYISVFRNLEENTAISGYTFYLVSYPPESLPAYGANIVLVITNDESFIYRDYFTNIHCILRSYGSGPVYLDGLPTNKLRFTGLLHFLYKQTLHAKGVLQEFKKSHRVKLSEARRKTLHVPLGLFAHFDPKPKPMAERHIDYAFLGSVGFGERFRKRIHQLITPPKTLARQQMLDALQRVPARLKGKIYATGDFYESIENQPAYEITLADTKISICPRGTAYETFRFFESCKAGCVVVCEPLPDVWFYQNHPGIEIRDWSRLPSIIEELVDDEAMLEAKSAEALQYWNNVISERVLALRIARFVESAGTSARLT